MRIGFDVSQTGPSKAGCGFYAHGLLNGLLGAEQQNEYVLYPTFGDYFFDPEIRPQELPSRQNVRLGPQQQQAEARRFWGHPDLDFETQIGNPDLVHANNFFAPIGLRHARLVFTLYDLGYLENWSWTTELNRTGCFDGLFRASVSADCMVAISHFTRRRFAEMFPHYPPERISVIYPGSRFGADHASMPPPLQLERRRFWLCVGTIEPRKNYRMVLEAYAQLRGQMGAAIHPLVIAGGSGWISDIQKDIHDLGLGSVVTLLGYVEDAALCWLYQNTICLICPSLYEGFGMPVLEAMSCASPVIASNGSAFPEIVGQTELASLLIDPLHITSLTQAMRRLNEMTLPEIDQLGAVAQLRARSFSWQASAESLLQIYEQVMALPKLFH